MQLVITERLTLSALDWAVVSSVVACERLAGWAPDYPADGDVVIAGMLDRAGRSAMGSPTRWSHRQVAERATGTVIGGVGFFGPPRAGQVEIGYGIVPSRRGCGYATEAVRALLALAFQDRSVDEVVATTDFDNLASRRVLEKAGFNRVASTEGAAYLMPRRDV